MNTKLYKFHLTKEFEPEIKGRKICHLWLKPDKVAAVVDGMLEVLGMYNENTYQSIAVYDDKGLYYKISAFLTKDTDKMRSPKIYQRKKLTNRRKWTIH